MILLSVYQISSAADVSLANRRRYPTVTTFTSAGQGQTAVAMRQFLRQNNWRTITVFCDELSLFPSAATFYIIACRSFQAVLTERPGEFQMFYETYDSKNHPDYATMLTRAKTHSRSESKSVPFFLRKNIACKVNLSINDHLFNLLISIRVYVHKLAPPVVVRGKGVKGSSPAGSGKNSVSKQLFFS